MSARFVCLVDADAKLNSYLTDELSQYGLRVESLADANELMSRKDDLPSLLVLCIDPKRTGWAVCNRLRKSASLKTVPLIITSAEATEKDFEDHKKLKTRAEDYLHKPFGIEALVEKIGTLVGLPEIEMTGEEISLEPEEISVEDEGLLVEEDLPEPQSASSFVTEDSRDRTGVGGINVDDQVDLETDAAFAAIGMDIQDDQTSTVRVSPEMRAQSQAAIDLPAATDDPFEEPELVLFDAPQAAQAKAPSEELDLGLDDVAAQAAQQPLADRPRRRSAPDIFSSTPAPQDMLSSAVPTQASQAVNDTTAHDTSASVMAELKAERDKLKREMEELKSRPQSKEAKAADAAPAPASGFSREREFLNLREIINKKEKEILDLRDGLDAKERQILDSKDKLRELERRSRDLDERALNTERELVGAKEKVEALQHDKERVVEREKQIKGRLDDALKTVGRYEQEIEGAKRKHAEEVAQAVQSYKTSAATHQAEAAEASARHAQVLEALEEKHAAQMREVVDGHESETAQFVERHDAERGRLEADHARALLELREAKDAQLADLTAQHEREVQGLHAQRTSAIEAQKREQAQLHADEQAGMRARYAQDAKITEKRHAEEVAKLAERQGAELEAAEERRLQELSAKDAERRGELDQIVREHLGERGRVEQEHEAAIQDLEGKHLGELTELAEQHAQKLADELKAQRESHLRKAQALEESHADLKAGMQQRHQQQMDELQSEQGAVVAEFEAALKQRDALITEGHGKVSELEEQLRGEREQSQRNQAAIAEMEAMLKNVVNDLTEREQRLADRAQRISELEQESAGYQDQILKAYQRIKSDESIVSRAKKALAIALTLLDESNADGSDEAVS